MTLPLLSRFEIINHGYHHAQYFQGCGTSFTRFDRCVTGAGYNATQAYNDAVEQINEDTYHYLKLPKCPRGIGITLKNKVPARYLKEELNETYSYVSIRYMEKPNG